MKKKHIFLTIIILIVCCNLEEQKNTVKNFFTSNSDSNKRQLSLQDSLENIKRKLKDTAQALKNTRHEYRSSLQTDETKISNYQNKIKLENRKVIIFQNTLKEQQNEYALTCEQIKNRIWQSEQTSKLQELDEKRQRVSRLIEKIKMGNKKTSERAIRSLDRSIKLLLDDLKQAQAQVPDIVKKSSREAELKKAEHSLRKIISNLELQENSIKIEASEKEKKLLEDSLSLGKEIRAYKKKIFDAETYLKGLEVEIDSAEAQITKFHKNFIADSIDNVNTLKEFQTQFVDAFGRLTRLRYKELNIISPTLKNIFTNFLKLEDQIIAAGKRGDWQAAQVLIDSINTQWDDFAKEVAKSERDYSVFENIYTGDPFLIHFPLAEAQKPSPKDTVKKYRLVFEYQMDILKDFLDYYPGTTIYIDGHADRLEYDNNIYSNVGLSQQRAENIEKMIRDKNILKPKTKLVVDWYSKHLNRTIIEVEKGIGGIHDRRVEMRIIRTYDKGEKENPAARKYKLFSDSLKIVTADTVRYFKHRKGIWEQVDYHKFWRAPLIQIQYESDAYETLLQDPIFGELAAPKDSLALPRVYRLKYMRSFELGSQLRTVLFVENKPYRIEICNNSATTIRKIKNRRFQRYLVRLLQTPKKVVVKY